MENSKGVSPRENQQGKTLMEIPFRSFIQSLGEYINTGIHPAILHVVTLLIPTNIYVIGDRLGAGVQWPLVRYQETYLGRNVISIFTDGGYILHGNFTGRTALSTSIWILGAILLFLALGIALWQGVGSSRRNRGYLLISGTFSFLISSIIQYGLYFHGPAGIFIPVGMPVLLILGGLLLRKEAEELPEVKGGPPPSRPRLQILILFLLCFLIYNTISSIRMSGDTTPAQMIPLSILGSGTISLDQFHASFLNPDNLYAFVQVQGHYYSYFPIVTPVLLTPLYVPPYLLISVLHIPLTPAIVAPLARYASAVVAASGVVLIYLTTRALFSKIAAILTTITYAFGTTTWAISSQAPWQHGMIELLLAGMIYVIVFRETKDQGSHQGSHLPILGILSGLLVMARPPDAILILPVLWYVLRYHYHKAPNYILPAILSGLPFVLYNILVFGSFFGGYQNGLGIFSFDTEALVRFIGLLVAPNVGFFIFSPVLLLGIPGYFLLREIPHQRIHELLFLFGPAFLINLTIYSLYPGWGGVGYGPRFLTGLLPAYILYLGVFLDHTMKIPREVVKRTVLGAFALLLLGSIAIQIIGAFYYPYIKDVSTDDRRVWDTGDLLILRSYQDGTEKMGSIRLNTIPPLPPFLTLDLHSGRISPFGAEAVPLEKAILPGRNATSY